jgi:heat shock protein HslJ
VTLIGGRYDGEAFVEGGASRPRAGLIEDFHLTGDLDQDGREEAVVMLWESSGGSGTMIYLAIMGRREGEPVNLGTAAVGDRVGIRSAKVIEQRIELEVVQAGPEDAACCPGEKATVVWSLSSDGLTKLSSTVTGRLSLADLVGPEWLLTHMGREESVPAEPEITLILEGKQIAGGSGCNRYFAGVETGATPGSLTVGVIGTTRMACPQAIMALEQRYLEALEGVTRFAFYAGKLVLTTDGEGAPTQLLFVPREPAD